MSEKFCPLDAKGMARVAALGYDYFSVTRLTDEDIADMELRKEARATAYYFADAGSTAADEQHRALHEYAGVKYTEKDNSGDWKEMAIGSDELADLLNDPNVRVWTFCEVFEEEGDQ